MKKVDLFVNQYPISKTLRFALIPVGKTEENFNNALLLETDRKRADEYAKVKGYIDRYHKNFIEEVLSKVYLEDVKDYAELYYKSGKNEKEINNMEVIESKMRKQISKVFSENKTFKTLFGQEIIKEILPKFLKDKNELDTVAMFNNFTTYFVGFHENRKNMYTDEAQTTAISYRCINENLPKFLDNANVFKAIETSLDRDVLGKLDDIFMEMYGIYVKDIFSLDYFNFVLTQSGIDRYNSIIGGYTTDDGVKVQGLNECINLYNQQCGKNDRAKKLPILKTLYKQILSDKETVSFIPESFEDDNEVLCAIKDWYNIGVESVLEKLVAMFNQFGDYNIGGIYYKNGADITNLSKAVFGDWSAVSRTWNLEYEEQNPLKPNKDPEAYYDKQKNTYNKIGSFSLSEIQRLGSISKAENASGEVIAYFEDAVRNIVGELKAKYDESVQLLSEDYTANHRKKLCTNDKAIQIIKGLLDCAKELEHLLKPLTGAGKEENKDEVFYGEFLPLYESISSTDKIYDKVRNYIAKKPYSTNKIKLNFDNPQHLGGWDKNKERDYRTVILRKDSNYYLGVMDKSNNKIFLNPPAGDEKDNYEKMEYKLLPGPNKMLPKVFFAASNVDTFKPSKRILDIRKTESFKKGSKFNKKDCHDFIDYFKESIDKHSDWSRFGFEFSPTSSYEDISEFYDEVKKQGYSLTFSQIPEVYINEMIDKGQLYLFKIYNKDFSVYSHGNPNLHTMYFKMLFDERNLKDVVYQLNGGAEMFYRDASIGKDEQIVHPANEPILNKNIDNPRRESVFKYDLIKDKRYTKRQFSLHLPITLNFKAQGQNYINNEVRKVLKDSKDNYVIGIDRGERNLLYICVVNSNGEIVDQKSLNEIISDNNYKVNYHKLLTSKENARDEARKSWGTIENIKELKEGYLSQVVHEICKLVQKYDAVIAMEDLNSGFKNSRVKVEKQVYQKFENMLITKLNYLVDKNAAPEENGGLLNAYQLTNKVDGVNRGRQNGFIFYVPAWLTSKIDPVTGFVDLLKPRYTSINEAKALIENMDDIRYNAQENLFEFDIDYAKYPKCSTAHKKKWTVCTNGERIINFRNKDLNNSWDNKTIVLTDEFKTLFNEYGIDYTVGNIKNAILSQDTKDFFESFIRLFANTLQLRNSEVGNVDVDYLISPVKGADGIFYDSRNFVEEDAVLPENADANGAYNIARKALWTIEKIKETDDEQLKNVNISIKNSDWLQYVQK